MNRPPTNIVYVRLPLALKDRVEREAEALAINRCLYLRMLVERGLAEKDREEAAAGNDNN